jgi:hypothetical protein
MPKLGHKLPLSAVLRCAAALLASLIAASAAQATPIEFSSFHLSNANQPISFTNNGATSASIFALNVPVVFNFTSQSGLSTVDHAGLLSITNSLITTPASSLGGGFVNQPISTSTTLSIIEVGTGFNLLTMSFTGDLSGLSGGPSASLIGADATGQTISYSSSFATFAGTGDSYNLGLATINPTLSIGPGGFLNSFVANIDGQFTTDSASLIRTPEPSSVVLFGIGLIAVAVLTRRRSIRSALARQEFMKSC